MQSSSKKLSIGMASNPGQKRHGKNQDSVGQAKPHWFNRRPPLLVLADGMGGYQGGEIASETVVNTLISGYGSIKRQESYLDILQVGIEKAHSKIRKLGSKKKELSTMGSTLVAVVVDWPKLALVNVGDSRAYLIREHQLEQISFDHSHVNEMVQRGEITSEEALKHPQRNVLTMSISAARTAVEAYTTQIDLRPDDSILLCSDGLWAVVPKEEIVYYVENFHPQTAADDLVKLANDYGGPDNISVIIAQPAERPKVTPTAPPVPQDQHPLQSEETNLTPEEVNQEEGNQEEVSPESGA